MFASMEGVDGGLMCGLAVAVRADAEFGRPTARTSTNYLDGYVARVTRAQARGELPPGVPGSCSMWRRGWLFSTKSAANPSTRCSPNTWSTQSSSLAYVRYNPK